MRRPCFFCQQGQGKKQLIDYKNTDLLSKFLTPWSKMKPRRQTRLCSGHQRRLAEAIKRARFLALLPYING